MQITIRTGDDNLLINQTAQGCGDGGGFGIPHARITNQCHIGSQSLTMGLHKSRQMRRTALLLAFHQNRQPERQVAGNGTIGPTGLDEGHDLTFIVTSPAGGDGLSAIRQSHHARLKRRCVPLVQGINRLNIVMAVKQSFLSGLAVRVTQNNRMAFGIHHLGFEPKPRHFLFQPLGGCHTMGRIGRIC